MTLHHITSHVANNHINSPQVTSDQPHYFIKTHHCNRRQTVFESSEQRFNQSRLTDSSIGTCSFDLYLLYLFETSGTASCGTTGRLAQSGNPLLPNRGRVDKFFFHMFALPIKTPHKVSPYRYSILKPISHLACGTLQPADESIGLGWC